MGQTISIESCLQILDATSRLYREDLSNRWYFLLLNRIFAQIISNPDFHEADKAEPILEVICQQALNGIDAFELRNDDQLISSANQLTEAYCGMP